MQIAFLFMSLFLNSSFAENWDSANAPTRFDQNYEYRFGALPLSGFLPAAKIPWSETYWASNQGSINIRWNAPGTPGFGYRSPSNDQVKAMTRDQLKQLSPAEKFDLARGDYTYGLTREVAKYSANSGAAYWEGICDGWAAAALQFREPKPNDVLNPDGIAIPFGSSDVKGLLSYYAIKHSTMKRIHVGRYCGSAGIGFGIPKCRDINPGSYHVILANELGIKGKGFAAEIDPAREIWNQPVFGFEFEVRGSAKSDTAFKAVVVHGNMHYTDELDHSQWEPVTGTPAFQKNIQETDYVLEMDRNDRITGGYWLTKYVHPDVFWKVDQDIQFEGDFSILSQIYQGI